MNFHAPASSHLTIPLLMKKTQNHAEKFMKLPPPTKKCPTTIVVEHFHIFNHLLVYTRKACINPRLC